MQYILTQAELDDLKSRKKVLGDADEKTLQELCTKIANEMPIKFWGREVAETWNCILTEEFEHYCDECPVQSICPSTRKQWSQ
mgnify:CR=1 FL=1